MTAALDLVARDQLFHFLSGTSTPAVEAGQIMDESQLVLNLAHELSTDFAANYGHWALLDSYYRGDPPLPSDPKRLTKKFRELHAMSRSNWCGLVVDVVSERLRIGSIRSTANPVQDKTAWQWWQANNMDGISPQIHVAALKYGMCYVSVWPARAGEIAPRIVGEPPTGCIVRYDADTGKPLAAMRIWQDNVRECVNAELTMPNYQYHLTTKDATLLDLASPLIAVNSRVVTVDLADVAWQFRMDETTAPVQRNPMGVVPYVAMLTSPDLLGGFASEIDGLQSIQDRINKTNFDRLMAQSFASFPRAWITGVDVPVDANGKPKEPVDAAVDRLWTFTHPDTKIGQLDAAELTGYLEANTADVQALATQSRTPPSYLMAGMGIFPSGESVRATEFGLTRKVESRQLSYGDAWSNVLRLCGQASGNKRMAKDLGLNVVWDDVEARSESELVDALIKMGTLGVPWPALWQRWGAKPEEIEAWTAKLDESAIAAAKLAGSAAMPKVGGPDMPPPISGSTSGD